MTLHIVTIAGWSLETGRAAIFDAKSLRLARHLAANGHAVRLRLLVDDGPTANVAALELRRWGALGDVVRVLDRAPVALVVAAHERRLAVRPRGDGARRVWPTINRDDEVWAVNLPGPDATGWDEVWTLAPATALNLDGPASRWTPSDPARVSEIEPNSDVASDRKHSSRLKRRSLPCSLASER